MNWSRMACLHYCADDNTGESIVYAVTRAGDAFCFSSPLPVSFATSSVSVSLIFFSCSRSVQSSSYCCPLAVLYQRGVACGIYIPLRLHQDADPLPTSYSVSPLPLATSDIGLLAPDECGPSSWRPNPPPQNQHSSFSRFFNSTQQRR
jgi:hypothetical protein